MGTGRSRRRRGRASGAGDRHGPPRRTREPKRKKLPLTPTIDAKRKCSAPSPSPWEPPKLRLETKLSQRRAPHEWSRHAGASTTRWRRRAPRCPGPGRRRGSCRRRWSRPSRPSPVNVLALAKDRDPSSAISRSARQPSPSRTKRSRRPVVEEALRPGAQPDLLEADERQRLAVAPRNRVPSRGRRRTSRLDVSQVELVADADGSLRARSTGSRQAKYALSCQSGSSPAGCSPSSSSVVSRHRCSGYGTAAHVSLTLSVPSEAGMSGLQM